MADPNALLAEVRSAAQGYHVIAELGRRSDTDVWFLARDLDAGQLAALRLREEPVPATGAVARSLDVAHELFEGVPMEDGLCAACNGRLRNFARFCSHCGADLAKAAAVPRSAAERLQLLGHIKGAAGDRYDVVGEMAWAADSVIYFAIDRQTARLVRLRLAIEGEHYALGETLTDVALRTDGLPVINPKSRPLAAEAAIRLPRMTPGPGLSAAPQPAPAPDSPAPRTPEERPQDEAPGPGGRGWLIATAAAVAVAVVALLVWRLG